ncbi:MAG TPA: hypothetical protein PL182_09930, partial [Pseudobdellovibrionaceae bacterium]|nr:hypothetical protein [Pseudobdellovibrionaceae bacterium]
MKTLIFALFFILSFSSAEASFVDCRNSDWFYLSVELTADKDGSSYIRSNETERDTSLSNASSDPVYVVVNDRELFKLMGGKVYEPRTLLGKSLGWKKARFTFPSDTSNSETSADLTQL